MFSLDFNTKDMERKLNKLAKESPIALGKAMDKAAIQFLNWANNGSPKESRTPPIKAGFLKGSSSAFRGGKLLGVFQGENNAEANKSYSESPFTLTWGWNAIYATRMHETNYILGEHSARSGDAGNKWLEKHIQADAEDLMKFIAVEFKKELGT